MAVTIFASTAMTDSAQGTSVTQVLPAGVAAGDYIVIPIFSNEETWQGFTIDDAGYTIFNRDGNLSTGGLLLKEAVGSEGSTTRTITRDPTSAPSFGRFKVCVLIIRGAASGLLSAFAHSYALDEALSATFTFGAVTAVRANTLIIAVAGSCEGSTTFTLPSTPPTGYTLITEDALGSTSSSQRFHATYQRLQATAGTVGPLTSPNPPGGAKISGLLAFPPPGAADVTPPAAPTGLVAADGAAQSVLSWPDNSEGDLHHYNVYRGTTVGTQAVLLGSPTASDYTDLGLPAGTYYYSVTAVDTSSNESARSNVDSAVVTPAVDTTPPSAPTGLVASDGTGQITLDWDVHPESSVKYRVYRSTTTGGPWGTKINAVDLDFSDYTDSIAPGTYYYTVTAVDLAGNESSRSAQDSGVSSGGTGGGVITSRRQGAATSTSFVAGGQFSGVTTLALRVSINSDMSSPLGDFGTGGAPDANGYAFRTATGLGADTTYYWRWVLNGVMAPTGAGGAQIRTLPVGPTSFAVAAASCCNHNASTNYNTPIFTRIRDDGVRYFFHMGDEHYHDPSSPTAGEHRTYHEEAISRTNQQALWSAIPVGYIYDDHDFAGNNSSSVSPGAPGAIAAYKQLYPHAPYVADYDTSGAPTRTDDALDYVVQIGRVHFFHMDTRTVASDRDATDNSLKTKLGTNQKARLKNWMNHASRKTLPKMIITQEVFADQETSGDGWNRYATERTELLSFISANSITNIVWVGGDMHALAYKLNFAAVGNFPVYQASPIAQGASLKGPVGGTDTSFYNGLYPADPAGTSGVQHHYGHFAFTDTGGTTVTLAFTGRSESGTTLLSAPTHTFTAVAASGATQAGTFLPDGVAAQSGYANATTANITNLHGDPDVSGGLGFTASGGAVGGGGDPWPTGGNPARADAAGTIQSLVNAAVSGTSSVPTVVNIPDGLYREAVTISGKSYLRLKPLNPGAVEIRAADKWTGAVWTNMGDGTWRSTNTVPALAVDTKWQFEEIANLTQEYPAGTNPTVINVESTADLSVGQVVVIGTNETTCTVNTYEFRQITAVGSNVNGPTITLNAALVNNHYTDPVAHGWDSKCFAVVNHAVGLYPEQVFRDGPTELGGKSLRRVPLGVALAADDFTLDASRRVILGSNPTGHVMEVSTRNNCVLLDSGADNVTIEGLACLYAADAGIEATNRSATLITKCETAFGHYVGVRSNWVPDGVQSFIHSHHNGFGGLGYNNSVRGLIADSEVAYNNRRLFRTGHSAAGIKISSAPSIDIERCHVHHNLSHGIWFDSPEPVQDNTCVDCRMHDNARLGLRCETQHNWLLSGLIVYNNGFGTFGNILRDMNLEVAGCYDVTLQNSVIAWGALGAVEFQTQGQAGRDDMHNSHVNNCVIIQEESVTNPWGLRWGDTGASISPYLASQNNNGNNNRFAFTNALGQINAESPTASTPRRYRWDVAFHRIAEYVATIGEGGTTRLLTQIEMEAELSGSSIPLVP